MVVKGNPIIHECHIHGYSDVYGGEREKAKWFIGNPDGALSRKFRLGDNEAINLVTNLPEELLEVVKNHYGLAPIHFEERDITDEVSSDEPLSEAVEQPDVETVDSVATSAIEEEAPVVDIDEEEVDIYNMNKEQLQSVARELAIKNYSRMTKDDLLQAIEDEASASEGDDEE